MNWLKRSVFHFGRFKTSSRWCSWPSSPHSHTSISAGVSPEAGCPFWEQLSHLSSLGQLGHIHLSMSIILSWDTSKMEAITATFLNKYDIHQRKMGSILSKNILSKLFLRTDLHIVTSSMETGNCPHISECCENYLGYHKKKSQVSCTSWFEEISSAFDQWAASVHHLSAVLWTAHEMKSWRQAEDLPNPNTSF